MQHMKRITTIQAETFTDDNIDPGITHAMFHNLQQHQPESKRPKTVQNGSKPLKMAQNGRKHQKQPIFSKALPRRGSGVVAAAAATAAAPAAAAPAVVTGPNEPSLIVSIFRLAPLKLESESELEGESV